MPIVIEPNASVADTYRRLRAHDPNLHPDNFDSAMSYCEEVFIDKKPIKELLQAGVVDMGGIEWDFELKNGIRSLVRRGFYKIIDTPFERDINGIPTWSAQILYSPNKEFDHYFKFLANVGPMVNSFAMGYNFTDYGNKTLSSQTLHVSKRDFFTHMRDKVFYVSQQTYTNGNNRQTVWFKSQ